MSILVNILKSLNLDYSSKICQFEWHYPCKKDIIKSFNFIFQFVFPLFLTFFSVQLVMVQLRQEFFESKKWDKKDPIVYHKHSLGLNLVESFFWIVLKLKCLKKVLKLIKFNLLFFVIFFELNIIFYQNSEISNAFYQIFGS